jgi:16S rRNA (cytosine967-C5)-methyltransferase
MPRLAAWKVLRSGSDAPLRLVDAIAREHDLGARDRGLLRALVGIEVRHRGTLRAVVKCFARGKPKPDLTAHLHLGIAQLLYLDRIPNHAAVGETVEAVARTQGRSKVPYANAVLRAVIRARRPGQCGDPRRDIPGSKWHFEEPVLRDPERDPNLWLEDAYSLPANLGRRWLKRYGLERTIELGRHFSAEPPLSVRVVRGEVEAARAELAELGADPKPGVHPRVLRCPAASTAAITETEAFRTGRISIQGETALANAELVGAQEGERLLDLCAAPGGKTAVLAGAGARVVATDVSPRRLVLARQTLARLDVADRVELVVSDGTEGVTETDFDGALVDAPCTNTGVLGARPGARWRFGPAARNELQALQQELLADAAARVRSGGRLVWSTCSLEPEENGQLVRGFLREHADWELVSELESLPGADGPLDGGYAARIERAG